MKIAVTFPGQGSQNVGMLADIAARYPVVEEVFAEASEVLKYDLWALAQNGPEETLNQTERTQPAMLTADIAIYRVCQLWRPGTVSVSMRRWWQRNLCRFRLPSH